MSDTPGTAALETKSETPETIEENEIRVTAQGKMRNYVAYAATVFTEGKSQTVVLKGMGRVINKTVSLAEILKRRVKGLYQSAEIGSIKVVDKKGGKNGDDTTEITRLLSVIKIVLTIAPDSVERYQPPIDESLVEPMMSSLLKRGRSNRRRGKKDVKETSPESKIEVKTEAKIEADDDRKEEPDSKEETKNESKEGAAAAEKVKRPRRRRPRKAKKEAKESEGSSMEKTDPIEATAEVAA